MKKKILIILALIIFGITAFEAGNISGKNSQSKADLYKGKTAFVWGMIDLADVDGEATVVKDLKTKIQTLQNAPTPTPEIVYKTQTQYVPEDDSQNDTPPKPKPVTYTSYGGGSGEAYGSNGSFCQSVGGNMYCSGGN